MRDPAYAACAAESGLGAAAYVRAKLGVMPLVLRSGERMLTVSPREDSCLCRNSSCKYTIYLRTRDASWRQVLDTYTMSAAVARTDGSVRLDGHASVNTIDQLVYAWDGSQYDFRPDRSEEYDVGVGAKPYLITLRFAPHHSSLSRSGVAYGTFGDSYAFAARAGQRVVLTIDSRGKLEPIVLSYGSNLSSEIYLDRSGTAQLPVTGRYEFLVDPSVPGERTAYRLMLSIR
jgi:hypothetical protein